MAHRGIGLPTRLHASIQKLFLHVMKIIQKFRVWYRWAFRFVTHDMWESGTRAGRSALAGIVKRLYLTTRIFFREELSFRASALTYSSLLSVVPILAIVFAIAKGFEATSWPNPNLSTPWWALFNRI